jgi:hypothetical protein
LQIQVYKKETTANNVVKTVRSGTQTSSGGKNAEYRGSMLVPFWQGNSKPNLQIVRLLMMPEHDGRATKSTKPLSTVKMYPFKPCQIQNRLL